MRRAPRTAAGRRPDVPASPAAGPVLQGRFLETLGRYVAYVRKRLPETLVSIELCGRRCQDEASDIDILLVVKDYPALQRNARRAPALLNPEALSSLFAHGPYVCLPSEKAGIRSFTTLDPRPLWLASPGPPPPRDERPGPCCILALQAARLAHLTEAVSIASRGRHLLLLSQSIIHSSNVLVPVGQHHRLAITGILSARDRLISRRAKLTGGRRTAQEWESLRKEAALTCDGLTVFLARNIECLLDAGALRLENPAIRQDPVRLASSLRDAFFDNGLGFLPRRGSPGLTATGSERDQVGRMFSFISGLLGNYLEHDLIPLGAESPFAVPGLIGRVGRRIWIRRARKRGLRLWEWLRSPSRNAAVSWAQKLSEADR